MNNTPLPPNWEQFAEKLARTLASVQQAIDRDATVATAVEIEASYAPLLAEQASKLAGLQSKATAVGAWVDAIEAELRIGEELLRTLLTETETIRQKLADWASRAIV